MNLFDNFKALQSKWAEQGELTLNVRKSYLKRFIQLVQDNSEPLADALNKDFCHRAKQETYFLELFPTVKAIKYCLKHVGRWSKPRRRGVSWLFYPAKAYLRPQALGVVGNMSPWNYPIYLALVPTAYAIASGNRAMVKFSELTPNTGELLASLIKQYFPEGDISIIQGDAEVAKSFAKLPFGHLIFTGSTAVGRHIMKAASDNLTPITLELGGKSPAIISSSMDNAYMSRLLMGKCFNAGQTCIAPDYAFLPESQVSQFESAVNAFVQQRYPSMPDDSHYTSIISKEHYDRLMSLIEDAKTKGARIKMMGEVDASKRKLPLTLLFNVTDEMSIMQEEIFGPLLPILTYNQFEKVIDYINRRPHPLALYYFGSDKTELNCVKNNTLSGALTINDTIMHIAVDDLPFGGVGESGIGVYHGREGFDRFSLLKPIFIQRKLAPSTWLYPPYGRLLNLLLSKIGGFKQKFM